MGKETLKQMSIDVNNTQANSVKESLHQFLEQHETIKTTKEQLEPLFTEVVNSDEVAEKMESTINKEHIKNLLTTMQNEFKSDGSNYTEVYAKWGKSIVFGLQSALRIMGYKIGADEIDGRYGAQTARAVAQYQTINHINVDGSAGYETFTSLMNANLDQKITAEESDIVPDKSANKKTETIVDDSFFTTNSYVEQKFGNEVNKLYTVINYVDIPEMIPSKTVVDYGNKRFFSNGLVIEMNEKRDIIRRGMRNTDLDLEGNWKVTTKEVVQSPVNTEIEDIEAELPKVQYDLVKKQILDKATSPIFYEDKTSGAKRNPYLSLKTNTNPARIISLNVALYIDGDGVVDAKKFLADAKKATDKLAADEIADKNYKTALDKEINLLRDKSYGFVDLFTKEEIAAMPKKTKIGYTSFFSMFDNKGGAKIDIAGSLYTKFTDATKSTIQIALDFDDDKDTQKLDKIDATNKNQFPVKDKENGIFDLAGKLREENLKKALKTIAKRIVEDPANGFINA